MEIHNPQDAKSLPLESSCPLMQMEHNIVNRYKDGVVGFHKTYATVKNEAGQRMKNGSGESPLAWVAEGMSSLEGRVYGNEQYS